MSAAASRVRAVPLPEDLLSPDTDWRSWRTWLAYGHMPWAASRPPLESLEGRSTLEAPEVPGVTFSLAGRRMAVASAQTGRPVVSIPVNGGFRKLYLLLLPLLDNHDVHALVARVYAGCDRGVTISRTLHFPGDLDWWCPREVVGDFATVDAGWTRSVSIRTPSAVLNVIEMDLGAVRDVRRLTIESVGDLPAIGVVAVSGLGPLDASSLPEDLQPPAALRDPVVLADFENGALDGWHAEGDAWAVSRSPGDKWARQAQGEWFADSLAHGEDRVGILRSPLFRVTMPALSFLANGWGAANHFALRDAVTGALLRSAPVPGGTGVFTEIRWDVSDLLGRQVVFEAVDAESKPAYAWIAFDRLMLSP
jgi:hypothetical protein